MKKLLVLLCIPFLNCEATAQSIESQRIDSLNTKVASLHSGIETLKRIKLSGYVQTQYQLADSAGQSSFAGGDFRSGVDKRFAVRRGRIKFTYASPAGSKGFSTSQYVLQLDVTEKGVAIKDAYLMLTDKWSGWVHVKAGMFDRPFGHEIGYSSSQRESPERGRMSQILFPGERDLGATIAVQAPSKNKWNYIRLEGGFFNGTGAPSAGADASDFDKKKDFIGRISMDRKTNSGKIRYGLGASIYEGGFRVDKDTVYAVATGDNGVKGYRVISNSFNGNYADRQYVGVDARFSFDWTPGTTAIRAEYIQGDQSGTSSSSNSARAVVTSNVYKRKFNGAYIYLVQNLGSSPFQAVVKYDWFDPNTDVQGDDIGKATSVGMKAFNTTDLRYDTWGLGLSYNYDSHVKVSCYYDIVKNETSKNIADVSGKPSYMNDLSDNVFTLRLQVRF